VKSFRTCVILVLAATTVGGAVLAWRQYGELVELRAAAMNRGERADMQKRIWDLEKANRELQDRLAAQRDPGDLDGLLAVATGETLSTSRDRGGRGDRGGDSRGRSSSGLQQANAIRELMNKPEVQAMVTVQHKAAVEARYAPLFKNLNLPADQIEKLKTLLADRSTTMQDVMIAAREQGLNPRENPEAFRKVVADAQNQVNDAIKSVIGDQGFAQLTNYEQTLPQRNVVNELQQRLSYTSTPLTAAQAEQMVQILANNAPQRQPGNPGAGGGATRPSGATPVGREGPPHGGVVRIDMGGFGGGPGGPGLGMVMSSFDGIGRGTAPVTGAAVAQAQTVLAPPQVAALQQIQQQQQTQQQLKELVHDALTSNRPPTPGSASGKTSGASNSPGAANPGTPVPRRRGGGG
jgi:hypothetical protein